MVTFALSYSRLLTELNTSYLCTLPDYHDWYYFPICISTRNIFFLILCHWHGPVLGGSKSAILGQICPSVNRFLNEFCVGCSTKYTATDQKHVCNLVSL